MVNTFLPWATTVCLLASRVWAEAEPSNGAQWWQQPSQAPIVSSSSSSTTRANVLPTTLVSSAVSAASSHLSSLLPSSAPSHTPGSNGGNQPHQPQQPQSPANNPHALPANDPSKPLFDCGTSGASHASDHFLNTVAALHQGTQTFHGAPGAQNRTNFLFERQSIPTINTHFHIVASQQNANLITQTMIKNQINAMNSAYAPYGIQFNLASSETTVNNVWAVGASSTDDQNMKTALRKGTYADLNIYFQTDLSGGNLGVCSLPTSIGSKPVAASVYVMDGCNVNANTMPGGQFTMYNYGGTAIHETGHWLGLLHTFEGYSCTGNGDYISDTPAESQSTNGCPAGKNTCTGRSGVDPIHNYMDYSYDTCYQGFSAGQQQRMQQMWALYRSGN